MRIVNLIVHEYYFCLYVHDERNVGLTDGDESIPPLQSIESIRNIDAAS